MNRWICILLCILLTLSGCAAKTGEYTPTGDALEYGDGQTAPTSPKGDEEPQSLTLTYYPDRSLHPYTSTDFTNQALFSLIYQGLFAIDRDYRAQPVLCKSFRVSEDMRTYTFYPESATFSDGTPLTGADVVASLNKAKSSANYSGRFLHISSVSLGSDGGVVIQLDTPYEDLPLILDIPILPQSQLEEPRPAGTGPYKYASSGTGLCLQRRSDWWCRSDLTITADTIPLLEAESTTQIRDNFQFGGLDLVCADPGSDRYADYRCDYELWDSENGIFLYIAFCADSEFFEDPEVRAAITYAVDRDTIAATEYRGFARSACLPASPLFPYYSATLAAKYAYDPERFAKVVENKGLAGQEVVFLVNSDDSLRLRVARSIAAALTDAGLSVTLTPLGGRAYQEAIQYRNFDMYLGQTRLSPNMDLSAFYDQNGSLSYGGVDDISIYTLCKDALANHGNYYTLHKSIMDGGYLCPVLVRSYAIYATRGLLTGLTPSRDSVFHYSLGKSIDDALLTE